MLSNFGSMPTVIATGVIILVLFVILSIFKTILSGSFIGFVMATYSYFVWDYYFGPVPLLATIGFILCVSGFASSGLIKKVFALIGIILSAYTILNSIGII